MDLEKIIVRIKSEFPKSAIDLVESIELVKFTVNDIMSAINNKMNEAFSLKDFDSVSEYSQLGKEIYKYEEQIDRLLELLDIESYSNEPEVINAEKVILNDSDYEVDPKVEHTLYEDFTHIRPFAFRLKGMEIIQDYLYCSKCGSLSSATNDFENSFQWFLISVAEVPFGLGKSSCCNSSFTYEANIYEMLKKLKSHDWLPELQDQLQEIIEEHIAKQNK